MVSVSLPVYLIFVDWRHPYYITRTWYDGWIIEFRMDADVLRVDGSLVPNHLLTRPPY